MGLLKKINCTGPRGSGKTVWLAEQAKSVLNQEKILVFVRCGIPEETEEFLEFFGCNNQLPSPSETICKWIQLTKTENGVIACKYDGFQRFSPHAAIFIDDVDRIPKAADGHDEDVIASTPCLDLYTTSTSELNLSE